MDILDLKETLDLKENQDLLDSKGTLVLRVFQGRREPSGPQERRVQLVNQDFQECPELTAHLVTLAKRGRLERRDIWAPPALKDPSVTPVLEA